MKVKTNEASGPTLNWMVTYTLYGEAANYIWKHTPVACRYSTDWSQGGPIIEGEKIELCVDRCDDQSLTWHATIELSEQYLDGEGPTPLIAAMRCYVASKLGDEVEVPDELV